jgi:hypothetical protein
MLVNDDSRICDLMYTFKLTGSLTKSRPTLDYKVFRNADKILQAGPKSPQEPTNVAVNQIPVVNWNDFILCTDLQISRAISLSPPIPFV